MMATVKIGTEISIGVFPKGEIIANTMEIKADPATISAMFFRELYPMSMQVLSNNTKANVGNAALSLKYCGVRLISTPLASFAIRGVNIPIVRMVASNNNIITVASIVFLDVRRGFLFSMHFVLMYTNYI